MSLVNEASPGHCAGLDGIIDLHRSVPVVLNGLDLDLSSSHSDRSNLYEPGVVGSGV